MKRLRGRITYANVTATLALVLALGSGGALAASAITGRDVEDGSLTGRDVRQESLKANDFASVPAPKLAIRQGPASAGECVVDCAGVHRLDSPPATCQPGEIAIAGGGSVFWPGASDPGLAALTYSVPHGPPSGWRVGAQAELSGPSPYPTLEAYAVCMSR